MKIQMKNIYIKFNNRNINSKHFSRRSFYTEQAFPRSQNIEN